MERIDNSNTQYTLKSETIISTREPYSKSTIWVQKEGDDFNLKLFSKQWKTVASTKDLGLSLKAEQLVQDMINEIKSLYVETINKFKNLLNLQQTKFQNEIKLLKTQINTLNKNLEDVNKKYNNLLLKLKK